MIFTDKIRFYPRGKTSHRICRHINIILQDGTAYLSGRFVAGDVLVVDLQQIHCRAQHQIFQVDGAVACRLDRGFEVEDVGRFLQADTFARMKIRVLRDAANENEVAM